jgi:hypothetical protein
MRKNEKPRQSLAGFLYFCGFKTKIYNRYFYKNKSQDKYKLI